MVGQTLLHYEIQEQIGRGGMGEVYRAHDSKLRRDVALKLLPPEVVHDADKLARFEREARVLASLNHPHIGAIYGLESAEDKTFLVLELVAGEDLGAVLGRGPLPLEQVLNLGRQIADGLETAHEQGIIHRDLKPQNIMLTPDGTAKILDFGLAKAFDADPQDSSLTAMPTVTSGRTLPGVVMGTAAYMSPEQARGVQLDRRTDIWAFGCVLFEMISGRRVFDGETVSDVLASVLKTDPAWESLPDDLPPALRRLLRRCFTRDPKQRLRDIGEARVRLDAMLAGDLGEEEEAGAAAVRGPGLGLVLALVVLAVALGAAGLFVGRGLDGASPEPQLRRYPVAVTQAGMARRNDPVVSPDGSRIVYEQGGEIWVQDLDQLAPRRLGDATEAEAPFWSPDGAEIGFFARSQMWRIPVEGGGKQLVCDLGGTVSGGRGAHWTEDGSILFSRGNSGILRATAVGSDPVEVIAVNDSTEGDLHEPFLLADGGIMFVVHPQGQSPGRLVIQRGDERQVLVDYSDRRVWNPRYVEPGWIIFERDGASARGVWALPYSLSDRAVTGEAVLLIPDGGRASVSRDGLLVYALNPITGGNEQMVWVDLAGEVVGEVTEVLENMGGPRLSPDGTRLALTINEEQEIDLWVQDLRRGTRTRFVRESSIDLACAWWPGADELLAFSPQPNMTIYRRPLDPSAPTDSLTRAGWASVTADGRLLAIESYTAGRGQIHAFDVETRQDLGPVFSSAGACQRPQISPDGELVAYVSDESGRDEIYVRSFPGGTQPQRVSLTGGEYVIWSRDGRRLFYHDDQSVHAVDVLRDGGVELSRPELLFDAQTQDIMLDRSFDVDLEGRRLLVVRQARTGSREASVEIVAVDGWRRMLAAN